MLNRHWLLLAFLLLLLGCSSSEGPRSNLALGDGGWASCEWPTSGYYAFQGTALDPSTPCGAEMGKGVDMSAPGCEVSLEPLEGCLFHYREVCSGYTLEGEVTVGTQITGSLVATFPSCVAEYSVSWTLLTDGGV